MRIVLGAAMLLAAAAGPSQTAAPPMGPPYLAGGTPPASVALSPPPPVSGSAAEARDVEASKAGLALRDTPRWTLAQADADLWNPAIAGNFSCAAGVEIGPEATPALDRLMHRTMADLGLSTRVIKAKYMRPRPFMVNGQPSCTPQSEDTLRKDGSYPSGHSAIGYGWGLILAELFPERASQIVARGRAFGDSRRVCNVHWLSDTEEGRIAAAATVARLHSDPAFRKDMDAVREELVRLGGKPPTRDCAAEAAALAL